MNHISIAEVCDSLSGIRDLLFSDAVVALNRELANIDEVARSLIFVELSPATGVCIRKDAVYTCPTGCMGAPVGTDALGARSLVYRADLFGAVGASDDASAGLATALNNFSFFSNLLVEAPAISVWAPAAARKLEQLRAIRDAFKEELCGDELCMRDAVGIGAGGDDAVYVTLALDNDEMYSEAVALPRSRRDRADRHAFVVLGSDLRIVPCGLLSFERAR